MAGIVRSWVIFNAWMIEDIFTSLSFFFFLEYVCIALFLIATGFGHSKICIEIFIYLLYIVSMFHKWIILEHTDDKNWKIYIRYIIQKVLNKLWIHSKLERKNLQFLDNRKIKK